MAVEVNIVSPERRVFIGTDVRLEFALYEQPSTMTDEEFQALIDAALAADTVPALVPLSLTGKAWAWVLRRRDSSSTALINKTSAAGITVEGTYNVDPALNTEILVVTLVDTDSWNPSPADPVVNIRAGIYRHSLKRTDDGFEMVAAFGAFQFLRATAV
jgi:hypothetical protein